MALAGDFDGLLFDLDGTVWVGPELVPGGGDALRELLEAGKQLAFVTNNPDRAPGAYAERLRSAGVEVGEERVVTAGEATARLAVAAADDGRGGDGAAGGGAFVIGSAAFKDAVAAVGFELLGGEAGRSAGTVLVAGHRGFDYDELLTATLALERGAALFATSRDPSLPMPGGAWPGTGAVLAAVETASGATAAIGGKPEPPLFELARERLGLDRSARVAMVGDRLASDIAGGRRAGLETILVLSGATSREQAEGADPRPGHVVDDLTSLLR
jgi:glycerol 3-phosphatase-2